MVQRSLIRWTLLLLLGTLLKRCTYQIKPVSSERNYTQFLLPWILFVIAKTVDLSSSSDSKSSLEVLNGFRIELDLMLKIIKDYTSLTKAGKVIEFCWIPSHVNIQAMREPTLQLRLLSACLLPAWNYWHLSLNLVLPDSALKNSRISGTVLQTTSFVQSIQLLANASTIISFPAMMW